MIQALTGTHPTHRSDIDGLRAVAVLSVLFFHANKAWLPGGFVGVDVFFVISGYLISSIILGGIDRGSFTFGDFYARRVKRIFPALLIVLATVSVAGWFVLFTDEYEAVGKHIAAGAGFVSNIVLWREAGYFDSASYLKPLLHLWSLGIEEQFYLIWPLIFVLLATAHRSSLAAIAAIMVGSFALNLYWVQDHETRAFYLPVTRFWELALGGLLAYVHVIGANRSFSRVGRWSNFIANGAPPALRDAMAGVGLALLAGAIMLLSEDFLFPGWAAAVPTLGTALLIAAGNGTWINARLLGNPLMVWVGLISYPLYLWHWPLLSFLRILSPDKPTTAVTLSALAAAIVLAWLTYRFVERPIRSSRLRLRPSLALIAGVSAVGIIGLLGFTKQIAPRSASFGVEKIIEASNAMAFPGPNLARLTDEEVPIYGQGGNDPAVMLIGDSEMEQYYPRIDWLLTNHPRDSRRIIYSTRGGCPPIPHVRENHLPRCNGLVDKNIKLAQDPKIGTIVIATDWVGYFVSADPVEFWTYYYEHDGVKGELRGRLGSEAVEKALGGFERMVSNFVSSGKTVFILLPSPTGTIFTPRRMIERSLTDFSFRIREPYVSAPEFIAQISPIVDRVKDIARRSGAHLINPIDSLCNRERCPLIAPDGTPVYRDRAHLNPNFVRNNVRYLDQIFMIDRAAQ